MVWAQEMRLSRVHYLYSVARENRCDRQSAGNRGHRSAHQPCECD